MNRANVITALTTAVNNSVTAGDIATAPKNLSELVNEMADKCFTHEVRAVQTNKDITANNAIVTKLGRPIG